MYEIIVMLDFIRAQDDSLLKFLEVVLTRMKGNARYAKEQDQVLAVETDFNAFTKCLADCSNGGKALIQLKNEQRKVLEASARKLAKLVEIDADGPDYVLEAGFKLHAKSQQNRAPFPAPTIEYLGRGTLSGTIEGFSSDFLPGVKQIAAEWRGVSDPTGEWNNGVYSTGKKFQLKDLPPRTDVEVRIRFIGTYQRESDPSAAVPVFVL